VSDECLQPVGGEGEGLTWCALWMATLGLAQLSTTTAAAAATDGVAFSLLPFALIWLVVDVQVLLTLDVLTLWLHLLWLPFTMTPLTVAPVTMALLSTLLWLHFYYDVQSALLFASSRYEVDVVAWHAEMTADRRAVRTDILPYPRLYPILHPPPFPLLHLLYSLLYCALTTTLLTTTVPTRCAPRRGGALRPHAQ